MDNSNLGSGGASSDQSGQTPATPIIGDAGGIQTPPPVIEPAVPGNSYPPASSNDPGGSSSTPPAVEPVDVPVPDTTGSEQPGDTGSTTTGM